MAKTYITDYHSHTSYSNCGRDDPEELIKEMIRQGIDGLGISDHNHGIGKRTKEYFDLLTRLRDKYQKEIRISRGIEICTHMAYRLTEDVSFFDYCLIENLDNPESIMNGDIIGYCKKINCKNPIIAHTDLFAFGEGKKGGAEKYFFDLAENGIAWEMNVSYDSIHCYREHQYVKEFIASESQQALVKKTGLMISVGFDGHRMEDYRADRVANMCEFLEKNNIKRVIL